ncbi:MAG TPA: SRPBCC family protein [Candidatus Bathyarchaeia archaeon]|nr:SRPBCC family protein [Candidatus Bathyarchaeia archaeon]
MARIEESIEIKCPVDNVFAYTTDAKNWPKWQSFIPEAEQTSQGPMNVGATFKGVSRMMGRSMKWTAIATEYESNKKWGKNITCGNMAIEEHVTYNPVEGATAFTIVYDMKVGGFLKLLLPVMAGSMRKETKKSLGNLKRILEA